MFQLKNLSFSNWDLIRNCLPASARIWQAGKLGIRN